MHKFRIVFIMTVCLSLSSTAPAKNGQEGNPIVVEAKKIYTAGGGIIYNGAVLIQNGKISAIGKNLDIPPDAKQVSAEVVMPGLIDIHSHLGVYSLPLVDENSDGNEMTDPVTPQVHALDSFNFDDPAIAAGRSGGVTTIVSRPGSGNVVGGTSVAVKLKQAAPEEMILKAVCDLKMSIEGNPVGVYGGRNQMPTTLMGVYYLARKAFLEAREYQAEWDSYHKDQDSEKESAPPVRDLGKDVLLKALNREIPVHIHCATASEIMSCIRLADEFNLQLSLGHCYWAYLIIDELKSRKDVHFNVGPPMFFNYYQNALQFKNTPAILADAGLEVSLQTDALGGGQKNLLHLAALCVRYGMSEDDALKSITLNPARAVNLSDRIGSLEPGKDADLVLLDGDPFEFLTSVDMVMIDGKQEYVREKNTGRFHFSVSQASKPLELPDNIETAGSFAIQAGTIYSMTQAPIKNGILLVKDGKIQSLGNDAPIPKGIPVIKASEYTVLPGLVNPRSYVGIGSNWRRQSSIDEVSGSIVPEMEVKHALEPHAPQFSFLRELGITTAMVTPGNRNVIGGQGAVFKTEGIMMEKMLVKDHSIMVFGMGTAAKRSGKMPSTRMGIAALLRETLTKAVEYREKQAKAASDKKETKIKKDRAMEALLPVLSGEMPVMIHCERQDDIMTALRIADEFNLKVILDGATDAYKIAETLKHRNIPVIIEDIFRGIGDIEDSGFNPSAPAILNRAGVIVAFRASEGSWNVPGAAEPGGDLLEIAAMAVKHGMPVNDALKAITINPARIIGIDHAVGSLEPGKDADLLILSGHPFRTKSVPEAVFIKGKLVYLKKTDSHL